MKCDFCRQEVRRTLIWCIEDPHGTGLKEQFQCGTCFLEWLKAKAEVIRAMEAEQ